MFSPQKSFEKSLRSTPSSPYQAYQVPIITPLKAEIHKGCTGKAHACGSIKSTSTVLANKAAAPVKAKAKPDNKAQRKNSLSSETVSDSGSESWNSNKEQSSAAAPPPLPPLKPLKRTKSVSNGSPSAAAVAARRRTSDSVIATDAKPQQPRGRLTSDGDENSTGTGLRRSSSFRSKNIPPLIPQKPKIATAQPPAIKQQQNGSSFGNGRLRNSFRMLRSQNQAANWNALWDASFSTKLGGGSYRVLDKGDATKVI
jgi:hypothetical protein